MQIKNGYMINEDTRKNGRPIKVRTHDSKCVYKMRSRPTHGKEKIKLKIYLIIYILYHLNYVVILKKIIVQEDSFWKILGGTNVIFKNLNNIYFNTFTPYYIINN